MLNKRNETSDSDSGRDSPVLPTYREKKTKKVMPKSMADEIDAEAEADGTTGLRVENDDAPKTSSGKSNFREIDLERALYRWYERYQEQRKEVTEEEEVLETGQLVKKAKSLVLKLGGNSDLIAVITKSWISRWQERYGVPKGLESAESSRPPSADVPDSSSKQEEPEKEIIEPIKQRFKKKNMKKVDENEVSSTIEGRDFRQALTIDTSWGTTPPATMDTQPSASLSSVFSKYSRDQIYFAFCFRMDWKHLPDPTLENTRGDPVWLLMAANVSGRHRTRILVTGKHWRPPCLRHVNMLSQPVVYAGGGDGQVTSDLLSWWFHREFIPAAESINPHAVLVASSDFSLKPEDCVSTGGSVRLVLVEDKSVDWGLIQAEFRTRCTTMLLKTLSNSDGSLTSTAVVQMLNKTTLKEAFPLFHKSWLSLRTESFQRCCADILDLKTSETISASLIHSVMNSDLINLSTVKEEEEPRVQRLSLTRWSGVKSGHVQEDRMMLLELQWLAHDLGMEVTDEDLSVWALESNAEAVVKTELPESEPVGEKDIPTASEAVDHLSAALLWMETMPLEPSLLMVVRDMVDVAKQASKMGLGPHHPGASLPFFCHNGDHLSQPPPAHMGIPPYQLDPKGASAMGEYWRGLNLLRPPGSTSPSSPVPPHPAMSPQDWKRALIAGLSRPPMYPFSASGAYPYPMLSPEISQVAASWHTPSMYPISAGAAGFRSPYPSGLPITSTSLPSEFYRFSPTGLLGPGHPGLSPHGHGMPSHPAIITPGPKQELPHHLQSDHNHRSNSLDKNSTTPHHTSQDSKNSDNGQNDKKKPHIKKPLNAFMLYMKEMRAKVVAECTLKESAAINQILGRRWHALGREEQAKYYELARRERQLHMQLYPDWSSRANSSRGKKRKRKQEANDGGNNMKKCRARYGLDQQSQWCKPCRRKKKCIRYMESGEERDGNQSDDAMDDYGSVGTANTPPDDDDGAESGAQSMSSPGGLSGLSSLTSPSMILPSPSTSLASPSVSLASPCMSLQSPLTPPTFDMKPLLPIPLPPLHRNPVGTNPHDVNNPLSVNQLTGKCIKAEPKERSRAISVT